MATSPSSWTAGRRALLAEALEDLELHRELGVRVVVDGDRSDVGLLVVPVEVLDLVLLAAMDVDRVLVDEQRGARAVALADDLRRAGPAR